jgi:hypothetical protein
MIQPLQYHMRHPMHLTQLAHMPELKMILSTHAQEHKHMCFDTTLKHTHKKTILYYIKKKVS